MVKIKKMLKRICKEQQITILFTISTFLTLMIFSKISLDRDYRLLIIGIPLLILSIISFFSGVMQSINNTYIEYQRVSKMFVKKNLSQKFKRVICINNIVKNNININDQSNCFAKLIDEDVILIVIKDVDGNVVDKLETLDYVWFVKNFNIIV